MAYLNEATILGNLGNDPELRHTQSGTAVCNFSVATNRRWVNNSGEMNDDVEWHRIVCWQRTAEIAAQYLRKGSQVLVKGRLQTRKWEDREGITRYQTEIVCFPDGLQLLGQPNGNGNGRRRHEENDTTYDDDIGGEPIDPNDMPF